MVSGGALCDRGKAYVESEVKNPMRTIATSVAVKGGAVPLVSVRLDKAIPKAAIFGCMAEIRKLCLQAPVRIGDVVLKNVCDSGSNVIVTKNIDCIANGK